MDEVGAIETVLDAIESLGIQYVVVGSLSSNTYGIVRTTQDADILVEVAPTDITQLRGVIGSPLRWDDQLSFETVTGKTKHLIRLEDPIFQIELFEIGDDPFDRSRMSRRQQRQVGQRKRFVPTAEDVILQKLRWYGRIRRNKDWDDVLNVLAVQYGRLDWDYLWKWADRLNIRAELTQAVAELPAELDSGQ